MIKRILIIDDDESILELLGIIFEDEGYHVVMASNSDATTHMEACSPDLIVLDIRLAGSAKDGLEICRELKSQKSTCQIPVLLLSAESDLEYLALSCKADGYLHKPFDIAKLVHKAAQLL